ncbi:acyltransferase [Caulobacter henricii]|uniref:Acyltransferase n=2 Tax=Caulobacter henricii TaxID=69395 RepID=A0A0P0P4C2_9CAUL|nr:acyltransferase [Caulobacter henricii]
MADSIAPLGGRSALDHVSDLLALKVEVRGLEHLPATGRVIVVANHPTGIADGVAVYDALKAVRPDIVFYANADAHRVCSRFDEVLIPVEWVEAKRTRDRLRLTLSQTREAMEAERALMIFPAGRLAVRDATGRLSDPPWAASAVSIARKHAAPILPVHVAGPWSTLFHLFDRYSRELRDITLFHELLNKQGRPFSLTVGRPIDPDDLPTDSTAATVLLKRYVEEDLQPHPESSPT